MVVERSATDGAWDYHSRADVRRPGTRAWVSALGGTFRPGAGGAASRGAGFFLWEPAAGRAAGMEEGEEGTTRLEIRYDLRGEVHVEAEVDFDRPDMPTTLLFTQDVDAHGAGSWSWAYPWDVDGVEPIDELEVRARWQPDRAGRSDARLTLRGSPIFQGPWGNETCWDAGFERVYFRSDDRSQCANGACPEGDADSCAFPALFP